MMRLKDGQWYAAFRHKGKFVGCSLEAREREKLKAQINLGKLLERLERGDDPRLTNKKISHGREIYFTWLEQESGKSAGAIKDSKDRFRLHIGPAFHDFTFGAIDSRSVLPLWWSGFFCA